MEKVPLTGGQEQVVPAATKPQKDDQIARMRELEDAVKKSDGGGIRTRWESGRYMLSLRQGKKQLPNGLGEQAVLLGVRPSAIRHAVRDAQEVFELRDGALVARNNATDPSDPLSPLTPACWLQQLAKAEPYLFAGKAH